MNISTNNIYDLLNDDYIKYIELEKTFNLMEWTSFIALNISVIIFVTLCIKFYGNNSIFKKNFNSLIEKEYGTSLSKIEKNKILEQKLGRYHIKISSIVYVLNSLLFIFSACSLFFFDLDNKKELKEHSLEVFENYNEKLKQLNVVEFKLLSKNEIYVKFVDEGNIKETALNLDKEYDSIENINFYVKGVSEDFNIKDTLLSESDIKNKKLEYEIEVVK